MAGGCGRETAPEKPNLPQTAAPGWTLKSYESAPPPAGVPAPALCWKAEYSGAGTASVWTCGYTSAGGAFDAVQRARAEADTVKFQQGRFLVIASWSGADHAGATSLVRAVQAAIKSE